MKFRPPFLEPFLPGNNWFYLHRISFKRQFSCLLIATNQTKKVNVITALLYFEFAPHSLLSSENNPWTIGVWLFFNAPLWPHIVTAALQLQTSIPVLICKAKHGMSTGLKIHLPVTTSFSKYSVANFKQASIYVFCSKEVFRGDRGVGDCSNLISVTIVPTASSFLWSSFWVVFSCSPWLLTNSCLPSRRSRRKLVHVAEPRVMFP